MDHEVRLNQVGFLPGGPKAATVPGPGPFAVRAGDRVVMTGVTAGRVADFTALRTPGTYTVSAGSAVSHPFRIGSDVYDGLLEDAVRFFSAQRSGIAIDDTLVPGYGRPAGHVGVPPNQGDTSVDGLDVSGGWYDAGDHGKYVTSGALPASMLLAAYGWTGRPALLDEARWQVDWLLRMQVPPGRPHAGLAYHRVHDDVWTPLPMWPHLDPARRVLHPPSTAAGLHLAAAAAHAARTVTRPADAERCLRVARTAYDAACREPGLLAPDDRGAHGGGPYDDGELSDDFCWAAAELWLTTREPRYLEAVRRHQGPLGDVEWDDLTAYAAIQLAPELPEVRDPLLARAGELLAIGNPYGRPYDPPDGWDWGSTGRVLGRVLILIAAHRLTGDARYRDGALAGLDHVFGRNALGISFVTGWGTETAHRQRVRHFAHALDPAFPPPPRGSVAGGPASKDFPGWPADPRFAGRPDELHYVDEPNSETTNDVCIRWNAPLVLVAAWLLVQAAELG
jgi:endoglucanase